jgi:predicted O-methyltransferase YrrM
MSSSSLLLGAASLIGMSSLEQLQNVQKRLISTGTVMAPDGGQREIFPVAIGPREGVALRDCVIEVGARRTFETGLGYAISTLFICEGLMTNSADPTHVAMDPYQMKASAGHGTAYEGVGLRTLEEAGVRGIVEFHEQESQIVLPRLLEQQRTFDLAFIDGNHRFEAVFLDLVYASRLVKEGGVVFLDDTQLPSIRRAIEFCVDNLAWQIDSTGSEDHDHEWFALRVGPRSRLERPFTDFVDFRGGRNVIDGH